MRLGGMFGRPRDCARRDAIWSVISTFSCMTESSVRGAVLYITIGFRDIYILFISYTSTLLLQYL